MMVMMMVMQWMMQRLLDDRYTMIYVCSLRVTQGIKRK
jgi:hypothetical protein